MGFAQGVSPAGATRAMRLSISYRFETFTLRIHGYLQASHNASERELRAIATGRKAWLFMGSDDHATAAANLFSLIASCRLHGLDAEGYLADVIRVMPYWPRDRYLELAPKHWAGTRARLDPKELELPIGHITLPPPAEQQPAAD